MQLSLVAGRFRNKENDAVDIDDGGERETSGTNERGKREKGKGKGKGTSELEDWIG
jgi:hypothetical protein